nr:efflux RND transporter periplasmic adaptor subunit [Stutzerimonas nosocomialis]
MRRCVTGAAGAPRRSRLRTRALERLRNWDVGEAQLERLRRTGRVTRTLTISAPVDGVVLDKPSVAGMRFQPGDVLYRIADLDSIWLIAEVFEQDLALVRPGQQARLSVSAYPDMTFQGEVTFVYPDLSPTTRTAKVRIELANSEGLLKPAMFGTARIATGEPMPVLAVPESAVIDSGTRQVALVALGEGRFEPRELRTGRRADGHLEVLEGLGEGESVVTRANFLIDAESNLKAALSGMSGKPAAQDSEGHDHDAAPSEADPHGHGSHAPASNAGHAGHAAPGAAAAPGDHSSHAGNGQHNEHQSHSTPALPDAHDTKHSHGGH